MITVCWGSATDAGPRASNQDALLAEPPVFVVADGMGGHAAGELASAIAVDGFRELAGRNDVTPATISELIRVINERIVESAGADPARQGMGTTLVGLVMVSDGGTDYWLAANLGDSRLYRLTQGALDQVTVDHSYVQELIDVGQIDAEQAREHPQRNVVTRALGTRQPPHPEYWMFAPEAGERYLLCSDGLCGVLTDEAMTRILVQASDAGAAARTLVTMAVRTGGRDNATAIVIDTQSADGIGLAADADTTPRETSTTFTTSQAGVRTVIPLIQGVPRTSRAGASD